MTPGAGSSLYALLRLPHAGTIFSLKKLARGPLVERAVRYMIETLNASRPKASSAVGLQHAPVIVAFVGLFAAAILSVGHLLDLPVPCGASRGCLTVAAHPSSRLLGVPIAVVGVAAYLTQIVLLGRSTIGWRARRWSLALAAVGTLVSTGLLVYSHTIIGATCLWCLVSGVATLGLFILGLACLKAESSFRGPRAGVVWILGLGTALAVGGQAGRMERAALAPPIDAKKLAGVKPEELFDRGNWLGPADAPVTVIIFADFLCPGCRGALGSLLQYQNAHPKDVRVVYRHLPLWEIRGHETSKAAAALSEMAGERGKFWTFAHALHSRSGQKHWAGYMEIMEKLGFDSAAVEARLDDSADRAIQNVQRDIELAERLGIQATPTFIVQVGMHAPMPATERGLARILNSPTVVSLLAERQQLRVAQR